MNGKNVKKIKQTLGNFLDNIRHIFNTYNVLETLRKLREDLGEIYREILKDFLDFRKSFREY